MQVAVGFGGVDGCRLQYGFGGGWMIVAVCSTVWGAWVVAGCGTVKGLRKFIEERSKCRLYAFLHIAAHGLASAGCAGLGM